MSIPRCNHGLPRDACAICSTGLPQGIYVPAYVAEEKVTVAKLQQEIEALRASLARWKPQKKVDAHCPSCRSTDICSTLIGAIDSPPWRDDSNRVNCETCGWRGRHTEMLFRFHEGEGE